MTELGPFETLYQVAMGPAVPLPEPLDRIYGTLTLPRIGAQPYVISNFVTTLDGVVSLNQPGQSGGSEISGKSPYDRLLMGILRAAADSVIVGAGTLRAVPRHLWTAEHIFPTMAPAYQQLRQRLGKSPTPVNVIVSGSGALDLELPVFRTPGQTTLIVTTEAGERRLHRDAISPSLHVVGLDTTGAIAPAAILATIDRITGPGMVLLEGGPNLLGDFVADRCLDELFLTLAPQLAGREIGVDRPGLVAGQLFAPSNPRWSTLVDVRRTNDHLFLRYQFSREPAAGVLSTQS